MRNFLLYIIFLGSLHSITAQTTLTKTEEIKFKEQVIKNAKATKTIVSDFIQLKHLSFLTNDIKTTGKLVFKAPNTIKWEYTSPYKYTAIFKHNILKIDDNGNTSKIDLNTNKMFKNLNNLVINSVKGNMFDDTIFTINYYKMNANFLVKFFPKNKNMSNFIASFELTFNSKTLNVTEVKMIEPSNDYTKIIFKNKSLNTPVNDAVFNN